MKVITCFLMLLFLLGCSIHESENSSHENSLPSEDTTPKMVADTGHENIKEVQELFPLTTELIIYPLFEAHLIKETKNQEPIKKIRFVPLTESYQWSEHPDSLAIENKNLGDIAFTYDNYHVLKGHFRSRFLDRCGIKENDQIFVYSVSLDSIQKYRVQDIPLIAMITPYGTQGQPVSQYDYLIGFDMASCKVPTAGYTSNLVYVGDLNPFKKGELVPISWKEIKSEEFPLTKTDHNTSTKNYRYPYKPLKTYYFKYNELEYFVQNLGKENNVYKRHLAVVVTKTQKVIFDKFYSNSEGTYLLPLNGIEKADYENHNNQWTGQLFKNRPPVIFGFEGVSFGCPRIDFLDNLTEPVFIRCDNRH